MTGASLMAFLQYGIVHGLSEPMVSEHVLLLALFLAIGATVLPTFLMNAALHHISAQANAAIGNLSPIVTIVLAVLILDEPLTLVDAAGAALVLAGIGWFTMGRRTAK
jgi:drug/metabolite transporter (DMT)-like permease